MRTKTLALSALLTLVGSASVMAQATNVYSLNAVGYVTVTIPANALSIIACPLQASPDNTLNTIMNNGNGTGSYTGPLTGCSVTFVTAGENPSYSSDTAAVVGNNAKLGQTQNTNGWLEDGVLALNPGAACWFDNPTASPVTLTFVGQVPQGSLTNHIVPGYGLYSSAVPTSGDLESNSITALTGYTVGDDVYMYDPTNKYANSIAGSIGGTYTTSVSTGKNKGTGYNNNWNPGDPTTYAPSQGFYYFNSTATTYTWVENFSINP
jgi:hypothetical protein